MMKTTGLLALAAAGLLALAGCSPGSGAAGGRARAAEGRSTGVKLSMLAYVNRQDPAESSNWDYEVGIFRAANPDIDLEAEFAFTNPYHDELKARVAAGKLPDLAFLWPDKRTAYFTGKGLAKDLRPYIKGHEREFAAGALDPQHGGGLWELPEQVTATHVMYSNTRLLAALGLAPAKSLEELLAQVPVIRSRGLVPVAMDDQDGWQVQSCLLSALVERTGGRAWVERAVRGDGASFSDAQFVDALQVIGTLAERGAFPPGICDASYGTAASDFVAERATYMIDGGWRVNTLVSALTAEQQQSIDLGTFPELPDTRGTPASTSTVVGTGYGMSARLRGAAADAAWRWIWFYAGPVGSAIRQGFGANPAYILPKRSSLAPLVQKLIDFVTVTPGGYVLDSVLDPATMAVLEPDLKQLIRGAKGPRQVADELERWVAENESGRR